MDGPATLIEFMERYPTEDACRQAVFEQRWPDGFRCPRCEHDHAYLIEDRKQHECASCGYQASVTAGTIFHKTRTDLRKWFMAIYLLATMKKAPSAAELGRQLDVAQQTAWTMRRKIVKALARGDHERQLYGVVELDESYIGGKEKGVAGRGTEKKVKVAVSAEQRPSGDMGNARIQVIRDASAASLDEVAQENIVPGSMVKTDGWSGYTNLEELGYDHQAVVQGGPENASEVLPWVHVVISNFKGWVRAIFHGVSPKHMQAYLDEFCYRLNRRYERPDLFRRVLNRCVRYTPPTTYAKLTAA